MEPGIENGEWGIDRAEKQRCAVNPLFIHSRFPIFDSQLLTHSSFHIPHSRQTQ